MVPRTLELRGEVGHGDEEAHGCRMTLRAYDFTGNKCVEGPKSVIADTSGECSFGCPAGYVRELGQVECDPCPAGKHYLTGSGGACTNCAPGTFTSTAGSVMCFRACCALDQTRLQQCLI